MRCPNCHDIIDKKDLYCSSCGYFVPSIKNAEIHPYAKKSNLPFISFLTGTISIIASYYVSYYFFIMAIIGFIMGFYSVLKYRRGVFGIIINMFAFVFDIFLIINFFSLTPEEETKEYVDYFSPYYGTYECSSDKVHTDLYLELNSDYSFQFLEKKDDMDIYAYGQFSYLNQTDDIESADTYQFQIFFNSPQSQYFMNDLPASMNFNRKGIFRVYGDYNIRGTIYFSATSDFYFCSKVS